MIALWMAYALVSGALIACGCRLLEGVARAAGLPTRGVWAGGMALMLCAAGAAAIPEHAAIPRSAPAAASGAPSPVAVTGGPPTDAPGSAASLRARIGRIRRLLDARVAAAAGRLARWDLSLLVLWALLTAFLGGVGAHAALEGRRLRHGLQPHDVAGAPVLLTEDLGPSAVGVGRRAILLPRWALELDDDLLTLVLRHEREHLAARDPLLLLAALLAAILLPWHLPLWWSRKRLRLAVEVDCDRRVLRAHPDVRRYGRLLLLVAQRAPAPAWAGRGVATVVAPLRPLASHLSERISAMTQPRGLRAPFGVAAPGLGVLALAGAVVALPAPRRAAVPAPGGAERVLVHLTDVGASVPSLPMSIVVYTSGGGRVGLGTEPPRPLTDTLRIDRLPAMTADVTDGDVHVELRSPGSIRMGGTVTGGPARKLAGSGRHLVLERGGVGIAVLGMSEALEEGR